MKKVRKTVRKHFNIPGYSSLFSNNNLTTIFIKSTIPYNKIDVIKTHPNIEISGVKTYGSQHTVNIYNIYCHPGAGHYSVVANDFCKVINKNGNNILVGDFNNSHSIMWGSNTTNKQG